MINWSLTDELKEESSSIKDDCDWKDGLRLGSSQTAAQLEDEKAKVSALNVMVYDERLKNTQIRLEHSKTTKKMNLYKAIMTEKIAELAKFEGKKGSMQIGDSIIMLKKLKQAKLMNKKLELLNQQLTMENTKQKELFQDMMKIKMQYEELIVELNATNPEISDTIKNFVSQNANSLDNQHEKVRIWSTAPNLTTKFCGFDSTNDKKTPLQAETSKTLRELMKNERANKITVGPNTLCADQESVTGQRSKTALESAFKF